MVHLEDICGRPFLCYNREAKSNFVAGEEFVRSNKEGKEGGLGYHVNVRALEINRNVCRHLYFNIAKQVFLVM